MRKNRKKAVSNAVSDIDTKFADIQKYINEASFLDNDVKEDLIMQCIACNHKIDNAIEEKTL